MSHLDYLGILGFQSVRVLDDFKPRTPNIPIGPNGTERALDPIAWKSTW